MIELSECTKNGNDFDDPSHNVGRVASLRYWPTDARKVEKAFTVFGNGLKEAI